MVAEEVLYQSVWELSGQIRARKISPVELTEASLDRLEKLGPKLGAVATITRERALEEARAAEKELAAGRSRGPLHGILYDGKDLVGASGLPATLGGAPF